MRAATHNNFLCRRIVYRLKAINFLWPKSVWNEKLFPPFHFSVYSLQCCKSNTGSCTNQQHLQTCGVLHDACITMTYVMHLDASINTTKTIRKYIKKCVAGGGPDCERKHCAWFYENHYKYCTVGFVYYSSHLLKLKPHISQVTIAILLVLSRLRSFHVLGLTFTNYLHAY